MSAQREGTAPTARHARRLGLLALLAARSVLAGDGEADGPKVSASVTGSYYAMRDQPDFGVVVAAVNRGPLRLEARHNYEARHATSAFIGWKLAGGDAWTYEITPLAGVLGGAATGGIAGLEASVARAAFDAYVEAEYVRDTNDASASYFYAWTELGWRPVERLRVGLVGQRTRVVASTRDVQRGAFAQVVVGPATLGVYAFNPEVASRYVIVSLGIAF